MGGGSGPHIPPSGSAYEALMYTETFPMISFSIINASCDFLWRVRTGMGRLHKSPRPASTHHDGSWCRF